VAEGEQRESNERATREHGGSTGGSTGESTSEQRGSMGSSEGAWGAVREQMDKIGLGGGAKRRGLSQQLITC